MSQIIILVMQSQQAKNNQLHRKISIVQNINKKTSSHIINRIKSTHEQQPTNTLNTKAQRTLQNNQSSQKVVNKNRPSTAKRPMSSTRNLGQVRGGSHRNSSNTTDSANSYTQSDVLQLISTCLFHNPAVRDFLREKGINESQANDILLNNNIYILSLLGTLAKTTQQKVMKTVQKSIISKINRVLAFEGQIEQCKQIQVKIGQLIQKRIRVLSSYDKP